jgi:hypothetical protein
MIYNHKIKLGFMYYIKVRCHFKVYDPYNVTLVITLLHIYVLKILFRLKSFGFGIRLKIIFEWLRACFS